jgi:hypothetical protein
MNGYYAVYRKRRTTSPVRIRDKKGRRSGERSNGQMTNGQTTNDQCTNLPIYQSPMDRQGGEDG